MLPFLPALLILILQGSLGIDRGIASSQFTEALALLCDPRLEGKRCIENSDDLDSDAIAIETSRRIATVTNLLIQWFDTETNSQDSEPISESLIRIQIHPIRTERLASVVASRIHPNRAGPA